MATKYGRMVTNLEWLTHNITLPFGHMVLQNHVTNWKRCISTTTLPMASKPDRMVTNLERLIPIILLYLLLTWSCEIMWQIKNISPLPQCLCPPNLTRWWLTLKGFFPYCYSTLWSCGPAKLRDKVKSFYLNYRRVYGHQACRMVTNHQGLQPMLLYPSVALSCKISPLPRSLWPPNLAGMWLTMMGTHP